METQQFMHCYENEWTRPQVIFNYHEGDEDIGAQDILKRARAFNISSKSFQLPTNERQITRSSSRMLQMSSGNSFGWNTCGYSDMYYPDLSECLDSTLEGSNIMQPFCHGWLLQKGSSGVKRTIIDKDERSHAPKTQSYLKADLKAGTLDKPLQNVVENSLDDYERTIEKARKTAEKYSVTEDPILESSEEKFATFLARLTLNADDASLQRSCESCLNIAENPKQEPVTNSLDDYEKTIERARQIAEKYSVNEDLITNSFSEAELKPDLKENPKQEPVNGSLGDYENTIEKARQIAEKYSATEVPKEKPPTFFESLKLKTDDAPLERSCEKTSALTTTNYLQKLKLKREEEIVDSTAELCVKTVLNKIKRELYVEAIRKNALEQRNMLDMFDTNQNGKQQNVGPQSEITCDANNETFLKKVSLLSSAHGFQWTEEIKISKRKSWRKRIGGLFCVKRCESIW